MCHHQFLRNCFFTNPPSQTHTAPCPGSRSERATMVPPVDRSGSTIALYHLSCPFPRLRRNWDRLSLAFSVGGKQTGGPRPTAWHTHTPPPCTATIYQKPAPPTGGSCVQCWLRGFYIAKRIAEFNAPTPPIPPRPKCLFNPLPWPSHASSPPPPIGGTLASSHPAYFRTKATGG